MRTAQQTKARPADWLVGGGDMGRLIRAKDWSATPLGPRAHWPQSLRIAVNVCLNSRFPMFVWWGQDLINIYNDGYVPMLGKRHPSALGRPARDSWEEIWDVVGPQAAAVMDRGEATWNDRVMLIMERHGYTEETYFTWSYSPIYDESGSVTGVFCAVTEDTARVMAERERDRLAGQRQLALDAARMGWWHLDPATRVARYDARAAEIFGVPGLEAPVETLVRRVHPDDVAEELDRARAALDPSDPKPYAAEYRVVRADGLVRWVEAHGVATFEGEGDARRAVSFVGTVADISDRKYAEELPRRIHESVTDAFFSLDREWRFTYLNPHAERILNRRNAEILGKKVWDEYPGLIGSEFERVYHQAAEQRVAESVTRFYPDHGRWYEVHAYPARDGISVYFRDVTERARTQEQLRRNYDTFFNLIQNNPFGMFVVDADFKLRQVSQGAVKTFAGIDPLLGRDFVEVLRILWPQQFADDAIARYRHTLSTGEPYAAPATVERRRDNGELESYDWRIERVAMPDGRFGVVCYYYDLSERQRWETALRESEARHGAALAVANLGTFQWNVRTDAVQLDERSREIFGFADGEGTGSDEIFARVDPADRPRVRAEVRDSQRNRSRLETEYRIVRPDGGSRWVVSINDVIDGPDGQPERMIGVFGDITDRKRATERVARLYSVSSALSEARTTSDVARVAVEQGVGALGASAGSLALLSEDGSELQMVAFFGYPNEVIERWRRFPLTEPIPMAEAVRDGQSVYLDNPQERLSRYPTLAHVKAIAETRASACVPLTAGGRIVGVLGLSFDQAAAVAPEDRQFVESLGRQCAQALERARLFEAEQRARIEAERASEAKSEFLATLSHELRTPLTPVLLTLSLMESQPALTPQLREDVATIRRNVELESRLISDLLDLTRIAKGKLQMDEQEVDLHLIVRSAIDICQREASAKLNVDFRAARHTVRGDGTRLQQIFWNLINNAIKFTPESGSITVRSLNPEPGRIRVEVIDTGVGIDPALLDRLFTAFEQGEIRALRQQAGLGLGLAISRKLAEAHGGTIRATSGGAGTGATFTVELPVVERAAPADVARPRPLVPVKVGRELNVLLVEDHEPTLRAMERLLRRIGHRVTGANSVASATTTAARHRFDLIISDLGLPDGSGLDVMRQLRDRYSGRAIALTGYGMESDIAASREAGFAEHLTKPIDFAALQAAIHRVAGQ